MDTERIGEKGLVPDDMRISLWCIKTFPQQGK